MGNEPTPYRAYLCCGPRCTANHSNGLVDVLIREVARQGLADQVQVLPGGCMQHCESGPTLTIWPGPIYYEGVNAERIRVIVSEHFGAGRPVAAYIWHDSPARARIRARLLAQSAPAPGTPPPPRKKRDTGRPSWRRNEGEVDDFKW